VTYREFALALIEAQTLTGKLTPPPPDLTDTDRGQALRLTAPGRPPELQIREATRVPAIGAMEDPQQRPRLLHAFANHELQAVELFAWALLAFPEAPAEMRRGLLRILAEEQGHVALYLARLADYQVQLGDHPVSGYFWGKTPALTSPLRFVCAMALTFENANLDHTTDYATAAREAGDGKTAALLDQIHQDEIGHVHFGWVWLERLKPANQSMWQAYCDNVTWPLRAALAKGRTFHPTGREAAGMDAEFIRLLGEATRERR